MIKHLSSCLFFLMAITYCSSQSGDILRAEYTLVPENDSGIRTSRYRFLANVPIKLSENALLIAGAEYSTVDFDISTDLPFDEQELERLRIIDLNLGYVVKFAPEWRFIGILTPRLASNFIEGIESNDFRLNITASTLLDKKMEKSPTDCY